MQFIDDLERREFLYEITPLKVMRKNQKFNFHFNCYNSFIDQQRDNQKTKARV